MTRTIYVIKTANGYLTPDGTATTDPFEAISFVDLDAAGRRLKAALSRSNAQDLVLYPVQVQFPRPIK